MQQNIDKAVDDLFQMIIDNGEADYIGENVTQLEHMCQAAEYAEEQGNDAEVILAALFHDIGHFCTPYGENEDMGGYGHIAHDKVGADYLRNIGFPEKVAKLVESHVEAKRYLCVVKPGYYAKLSGASVKTLVFQGGPMTEAEVHAFEADPLFDEMVKMRAWDELAKVENKPLPDLNRYKEMAKSVLIKQA